MWTYFVRWILLEIILTIYFYFVIICLLVHVNIACMPGDQGGYKSAWNYSHWPLWDTMSALGIELSFSGKAISSLNLWAISLVLLAFRGYREASHNMEYKLNNLIHKSLCDLPAFVVILKLHCSYHSDMRDPPEKF